MMTFEQMRKKGFYPIITPRGNGEKFYFRVEIHVQVEDLFGIWCMKNDEWEFDTYEEAEEFALRHTTEGIEACEKDKEAEK